MIGIVGGGIAGLAAAYRLQQQGRDVTIFEAQDDVGGLAMAYQTAGDPIEKYYHHLLKSETAILDLLDELGLADAVTWRVGTTGYYMEDEEHALNTPWEILTYPHLNLYDTFQLGLLTLGIKPQRSIPPLTSYDEFETYDDVPVQQFLRKQTTKRVYQNFWKPLLDAKFGDRKSDVSAAWLLGRIQFRSERDLLKGEILGYLDGGFERLITELQMHVGRDTINYETPVIDINTENGQVTSVTTMSDDGETIHDVDALVVATMPHVLEKLTGYNCDIEFQGTICSVVSLSTSLLDNYWVNIASDVEFGVLIEHTNFIPPERYGGEHLMYIARYVQSPEEDIWQLDNDTVEEQWLNSIESLYQSFNREQVNWIQTSRNPQTAPLYECGYTNKIIPYDLNNAVADGVYYAGMATRAQYPDRSLSGGIEAGTICAEQILSTDIAQTNKRVTQR